MGGRATRVPSKIKVSENLLAIGQRCPKSVVRPLGSLAFDIINGHSHIKSWLRDLANPQDSGHSSLLLSMPSCACSCCKLKLLSFHRGVA